MATKVGDGYIDVEARLDESNLVRQARVIAAAGGKAFESEWAKSVQKIIRQEDQQFSTHINKQISSYQALERQRVSAAQDTQRRLDSMYNEIARKTESDRRISDAYEAEGKRAADKFIAEQNKSFDRMVGGYRNGLAEIEKEHEIHNRRVSRRVDDDSKGWGRHIVNNLSNAFEAGMSLLPARLEGIFTSSGPIIGTALFVAVAGAIAIAAPALGAMFTGLFVASLGLGALLGAVLVGAANDPRVAAAGTRLKENFLNKTVYAPELQSLGQTLADQLDKVNAALDRWAPHIVNILKAGEKFMGPITDGLIGMVDAMLPALDRLSNSQFMADLMDIFADGLVKIGEAFGISFDRLLNDPEAMEGAKMGLEDFFNILAGGIKTLMDFVFWLSEMWFRFNHDPDGNGPQRSPIDTMRGIWKDIKEDMNSIIGIISKIWEWIDRVTKASDEAKKDWEDIKKIWELIHGRQDPNADNNGDAEGTGAGKGIWQNQWDDFKAESEILWKNLKDKWNTGMTELNRIWSAGWQQSVENGRFWWSLLQLGVDLVMNTIQVSIQIAGEGIRRIWDAAWAGVAEAVRIAFATVRVAVQIGIETIKTIISIGMDIIKGNWGGAWITFRDAVSIAWNLITTTVRVGIETIGRVISTTMKIIKTIWDMDWGGIRTIVTAVWNSIILFISLALNNIQRIIGSVMNGVLGFWRGVWTAISDWVSSRWQIINTLVAIALIVLKDAIGRALEAISGGWSRMWNGMLEIIGGIWSRITKAVGAGMDGVANIINTGIEGLNSILSKIGIDFKIDKIPTRATAAANAAAGIVSSMSGRVGGGGNFATGGRIYGMGSGTSDSVPINASKDEYMIKARSAKEIGYNNLDFINRTGMLPWGLSQHRAGYAAGGRVGGGNDGLLNDHRNHVHVAMAGAPMSYPNIIKKAAESGFPFNVSSTYRPGSRGSGGGFDHHSTGRAVDFGGFNQDPFASFWLRTPGVIELIHRTASRDYAIFGGAGGGGFLNQFLAKGIGWVMDKMLSPAINGIRDKLPAGNVQGQIGRRALEAVREGLKKKVQEAIDSAAAMDAGNSSGSAGGAAQWTGVAQTALGMLGLPSSWLGPLLTLIGRESGGNPNAVNRSDSNFLKGTPSMGLMQTIAPTFEANKLPGYNNILAPLDNILAGLRYIIRTYGSIFNVQQAVGSTPRGYDGGGLWPSGTFGLNTSGGTEMVLNPAQAAAFERRIAGEDTGDVTLVLDLGEGISEVFRVKLDRYNKATIRPLNALRRR